MISTATATALKRPARRSALIDAVVAEEQSSFGIELVSLLRTEDLAASEAELYARHHARLSSDWLELDIHQVEELRLSALQTDAHASQYLTRASLAAADAAASGAFAEPASRSPIGEYSRSNLPRQRQWNRRRPRASVLDVQYGSQALRRSRLAAAERQRQARVYRLSTEDEIKEVIGDFLLNHLIKISALIFVVLFLFLAYLVRSN